MTSDSRPSSSFPIGIAALVTTGLACLSLVQLPDGDAPEWLLFVGRFHPVMLHAPIGLLLALILVEITALVHRSADLRLACGVLLWMTALTSVIAVASGSLLALSGGYDEITLFRHRWLGVGMCLTVVWALALRGHRILYGCLLLCALGLMGFAGHNGGSLTHGSDYLVHYMPNGLRSAIGLPPREPPPDPTFYEAQIQPIFDRYCIKCHGATKQKGDLRLDSYGVVMAADVVTPGDAAGSLLVEMMRLPIDDLDRMPPDDKPQPSEEQVAQIERWIAAGAMEEDGG